jgi:hypothetical protein
MTSLRVAMIVFLAASIQAQPLEVPPSAAQLRAWIHSKSVSSGKQVGIDYAGAVERAIRREPAGLAEIFRYTVIGEMDGDTGEVHSAILFGLLQRWGDRRFAHVLACAEAPDPQGRNGHYPAAAWKPTQVSTHLCVSTPLAYAC